MLERNELRFVFGCVRRPRNEVERRKERKKEGKKEGRKEGKKERREQKGTTLGGLALEREKVSC